MNATSRPRTFALGPGLRCLALWSVLAVVPLAQGPPASKALEERVRKLEARVGAGEAATPEDSASSERELLERILARLDALETRVAAQEAAPESFSAEEVDLSDSRVEALARAAQDHVLARAWHQNFTLSGHGSFGFLLSGTGTHRDGSFVSRDSALIIEAESWTDVFFHVEMKLSWLVATGENQLSLWETYVDFRDLVADGQLGLRVGRFDIPFGEDYLRMDAPDTAFITFQAGHPYGFDEGIMAYGRVEGIEYRLALQNGNQGASADSSGGKAFTAKLGGEVADGLKLSGSFHHTSKVNRSAYCFAGSTISPVGVRGPSSLGASPSNDVSANLYLFDLGWRFGSGTFNVSFGQGFIDDEAPGFDRTITWFNAELLFDLNDEIYLAGRWSEIGTYDDDEGYHFNGRFPASSWSVLGDDVSRLTRLSLVLGWRPNPCMIIRLECGWDLFELIDSSALNANNDRRWFIGSEVVLTF